MIKKHFVKVYVLFTTILLGFLFQLSLSSSVFALEITGVVADNAANLLVIQGSKNEKIFDYRLTRLSDPDRFVIDIPNAVLNMKKNVIQIEKNGIENIRFAQFSAEPEQIVRVVLTAKSRSVLDTLKVFPSSGGIIVRINSIEENQIRTQFAEKEIQPLNMGADQGQLKQVNPKGSSINSKAVVINKLYIRDGELVVAGSDPLQIDKPYILKSPTRLIYDIRSAVLEDNNLSAPIIAEDDQYIKSVKVFPVNQGDQNIIRLVVETDHPERLYPVFSLDQHAITLSTDSSMSVNNLPEDSYAGMIQDIDMRRDYSGTVISIKASSSILHRLRRAESNNQIVVDLLNLTPASNRILNEFNKTDEVDKIYVVPLAAHNKNSRLIVDLASDNVSFTSSLMDNGRTLELRLMPPSDLKDKIAIIPDKRVKIVLDAGHGGYDQGASRAGILEKDINLRLTKKLKQRLESKGIKVYMTRTGDESVSLQQRVALTNRIKPDLFVSVHTNSSTRTAPHGLETYWYTRQSVPLAKEIHNQMVNKTGAVDRGVQKAMFYVIHHTNVPAVLVEIGFISNPRERAELLTAKRTDATVDAISTGILRFLGNKYSASSQ